MAANDLYKAVPVEQMENLMRFRVRHPCQSVEIGRVTWEYLSGGRGPETLLLLPGGLRIAEHAHPYIQTLEADCRVIVPTYPPLASIDELTDGLAQILDREQAPSVSVLGQSYGGMVAQVFVQRFPSRVNKLILSSAGPLQASKPTRIILTLLLALVPRLSENLAKALYKTMLSQVLEVPESARAFWQAYLKELFSQRLTKADVISHLLTGQGTLEKYAFDQPGVEPWVGDVLILGGEKDPISTASDRKGMFEFYPHAQIHVIPEAGHTAGISEPVKFAEIVTGFLRSKRPRA